MRVSRRDLLKMSLGGAVALLLPVGQTSLAVAAGPGGGGMGGSGGGGGGGGGMGGTASPPTRPFVVELRKGPPLTPVPKFDAMLGGYYDHHHVTIERQTVRCHPDLPPTTILGYNGSFPGPTIRARSGRYTVVRFTNKVPENMVIHLHGGHVPVLQDGHAMDFIAPAPAFGQVGGSRSYIYPNNQQAATLLYHDHTMDLTAEHVYQGLAGFYIIEDAFEDGLPLPRGDQDVELALQDRLFNADGSLNYTLTQHSLMHGMQGDVVLVNGLVQPFFKVGRGAYRFRILNGSNGRFYRLALSAGGSSVSFVQIGSDGGLLAAPLTMSSVDVAPGERVELVVNFGAFKVGNNVILKNLLGSGRTGDLLRFDMANIPVAASSIPRTLRPVARIPASQAAATRTFTLGMDMMSGKFTINGLPYDHMRVDAKATLGATEIWEYVNPMGMAHPMHAHDIMWQILDRNGAPPPANEMGWKDTFVVPPQGRLRTIGTFTDYTCHPDPMMHLENYMIHCHILEHEDNGMMAQFKVIGDSMPMPM